MDNFFSEQKNQKPEKEKSAGEKLRKYRKKHQKNQTQINALDEEFKKLYLDKQFELGRTSNPLSAGTSLINEEAERTKKISQLITHKINDKSEGMEIESKPQVIDNNNNNNINAENVENPDVWVPDIKKFISKHEIVLGKNVPLIFDGAISVEESIAYDMTFLWTDSFPFIIDTHKSLALLRIISVIEIPRFIVSNSVLEMYDFLICKIKRVGVKSKMQLISQRLKQLIQEASVDKNGREKLEGFYKFFLSKAHFGDPKKVPKTLRKETLPDIMENLKEIDICDLIDFGIDSDEVDCCFEAIEMNIQYHKFNMMYHFTENSIQSQTINFKNGKITHEQYAQFVLNCSVKMLRAQEVFVTTLLQKSMLLEGDLCKNLEKAVEMGVVPVSRLEKETDNLKMQEAAATFRAKFVIGNLREFKGKRIDKIEMSDIIELSKEFFSSEGHNKLFLEKFSEIVLMDRDLRDQNIQKSLKDFQDMIKENSALQIESLSTQKMLSEMKDAFTSVEVGRVLEEQDENMQE